LIDADPEHAGGYVVPVLERSEDALRASRAIGLHETKTRADGRDSSA